VSWRISVRVIVTQGKNETVICTEWEREILNSWKREIWVAWEWVIRTQTEKEIWIGRVMEMRIEKEKEDSYMGFDSIPCFDNHSLHMFLHIQCQSGVKNYLERQLSITSRNQAFCPRSTNRKNNGTLSSLAGRDHMCMHQR
jgi:hypothetical protein